MMALYTSTLALLLASCSGRPSGAAAGAEDSGAPSEEALDSGPRQGSDTPYKEADAAPSQAPEPQDSTAAPEIGWDVIQITASPNASQLDASGPIAEPEPVSDAASPPDAASAPELEAFLTDLDTNGFSRKGCDGLASAVAHCCAGGELFACSEAGCGCDGVTQYAPASSLCLVAPAVPFAWECAR